MKIEIDLNELEAGKPHWMSEEKTPERIRARARERWFAEREEGKKPKSKTAKDFNPYHEPGGSPEGGRFASGPGGGGGEPETYERGGGGGVTKSKAVPDLPPEKRKDTRYEITADAIKAQFPQGKNVLVRRVAENISELSAKVVRRELNQDKITFRNHDERTDDYLASLLAVEMKDELKNSNKSSTWYDDDIEEAMRIATKHWPEVATDPDHKFAIVASLAISSQGATPVNSAIMTRQVYERWLASGSNANERRFPTDIPVSEQNVPDNFQKLNDLLDKGMTLSEISEMFDTTHTVKEWEELGYTIPGLGVDDVAYGSAILGPKIGQGFYQNLSGNFEPLTMDLWFMRGWGRLTNTLIEDIKGWDKTKARVQQSLTDAGFSSTDDEEELYIIADGEKRAYEREFKEFRKTSSTGMPYKSELVYASERYLQNYGGTIYEAPRGVEERRWMIDVFDRARAKLAAEGIKLTQAAAQATWWTPEQRLYKYLGSKVKHLGEGYAKGFKTALGA